MSHHIVEVFAGDLLIAYLNFFIEVASLRPAPEVHHDFKQLIRVAVRSKGAANARGRAENRASMSSTSDSVAT